MLIDELRIINCIIFPNWHNLEALATDLKTVLNAFVNHPATPETTLLLDSRSLPDELQEEANTFLCNVVLEHCLSDATSEDLYVGLTGTISLDEWYEIQPLINFRIPIPSQDEEMIRHPAISALPIATIDQIIQPTLYEEARRQSLPRWGDYCATRHLVAEANSYYTRYLSLDANPSAYLRVSNGWLKAGENQRAIDILQDGISRFTSAPELYFWLIVRLKQSQRYSEAQQIAQIATERFPHDYAFKFLYKLMLPEIYDSVAQIEQLRLKFQQGLREIIDGVDFRDSHQIEMAFRGICHHTNFFLAYQAKNDVLIQQQYGHFVHRIMTARYPQWSNPLTVPEANNSNRIKIGYLSYFLRGWSGTFLFLNWLKYANRNEFEIYAYHTGSTTDKFTDLFRSYSDHFYHIPESLEQVCQQVINDRLHVLIFPELGMDATSLCIAGLRLAPIQCMAWGHPVTSGIPTVDYFLSSELMEPAHGQEHYTEQLVRLPGVGISYPTIHVPPVSRNRSFFGLRDDAVVYLSSQAPYKYLPQHDYIYAAIALEVPNAQFMFLRSGIPAERLERAFAMVGLNSQDYCVFSPVLPRHDYFNLLSLVDVYLDTLDWSGGNTTLDAIACHLPVVTCPGEFMRGRHSYGFLQAMGVTETIATDAAQYIEIAVKLGLTPNWRAVIRDMMKQTSSVLFENPTATRNLERFIKKALANCS
ncbi:MAG: hypothetical protein Q6K90_02860 [Gloeomargarita sp. HHBFW_bins_162]